MTGLKYLLIDKYWLVNFTNIIIYAKYTVLYLSIL
jgi:hypothetical protein